MGTGYSLDVVSIAKWFWLLLVRSALGVLLSAGAVAACPNQPITVAFYDLGILYNPKTGSGLDHDVVAEVFRRVGCPYVADYQSRVRIWNLLADGQLDMTVSGIPTPERRVFAHFIPYFYVRNQLVYMADHPLPSSPAKAMADNSFRLGVVKAYKHGAGWDEWIEQLRLLNRVEESPDTKTLVRLLKGGRISAFPALPPVVVDLGGRYEINSETVRQTQWFLDRPKIEHGLVLSKHRISPKILAEIESAITQMRQDGTLLKIYRQYFTEFIARDMISSR